MEKTVLFKNGSFVTFDSNINQAYAVRVSNGRITDVYSDEKSVPADSSITVDLEGKTVIPGMTDSHIHVGMLGQLLREVDLSECESEDECVEKIKKERPGICPAKWIFGRRWTNNLWKNTDFPSKKSLDAAFPHNPVLLISRCHHVTWCNSLAMKELGMTKDTDTPEGGVIHKDSSGELTGIFLETASDNLVEKSDIFRPNDYVSILQDSFKELNKHGITAVHTPEELPVFYALQLLKASGNLKLRVNYFFPYPALENVLNLKLVSGLGDEWLKIAGVKLFVDGSLGGRTALMIEPFENEPDNYGVSILSKEELTELVIKLNKKDLAAKVHAIGDKAVKDILEIYEKSLSETGKTGIRNRIEHFQLFRKEEIDLIKKLKPIASVQPAHLCADHKPADKFWGKRARYAYAFKTLLECGATLIFGSDGPVEPINPFLGIYAAVTRKDEKGNPADGWYPEEKIDVKTAVEAYTVNPALATDEFSWRGSISKGKVADFVVLDRDIFSINHNEIKDTKVLMTVLNGEIVYSV